MELKFDWEYAGSSSNNHRELQFENDLVQITVVQSKCTVGYDTDFILKWDRVKVFYDCVLLPSTPTEIETWIELLTDVNTILHEWNGE